MIMNNKEIKNLINNWENETNEEKALDIDNFLNNILEIKNDTLKKQAKENIQKLNNKIEFELLEIKQYTKKEKTETYEFNKPFKKMLKKIIKKIKNLTKSKKR